MNTAGGRLLRKREGVADHHRNVLRAPGVQCPGYLPHPCGREITYEHIRRAHRCTPKVAVAEAKVFPAGKFSPQQRNEVGDGRVFIPEDLCSWKLCGQGQGGAAPAGAGFYNAGRSGAGRTVNTAELCLRGGDHTAGGRGRAGNGGYAVAPSAVDKGGGGAESQAEQQVESEHSSD